MLMDFDTALDTFEVEVNSTVNLIDVSEEEPTEWDWSFSGADIASSILQNPSISYPDTGVYEVTLSVTNEIGTDEITKYIRVVTPTGLVDNHISRSIGLFPNPAGSTSTISIQNIAIERICCP